MGIKGLKKFKRSNYNSISKVRSLRPCTLVRKKEGAYDKNSQDKHI